MKSYVELVAAALLLVFLLAWLANRHARALVLRNRIKVHRFKLRSRHAAIRFEVFSSPDVVAAIRRHAKEHRIPVEVSERIARLYLAEILPKFNLLAYYRFGAPIARLLLYFLYRVVVEKSSLRDLNGRLPKNAAIIYVINHRSNVDYLLVAHMLFKFISLSYAVGEWARVWPLNHLFKWFGGYFIRRRFREPLYHAVLSQFVATITKEGVTQGIFIEGGLSRDGAFQKPKLGMLDYIIGSKRDLSFTAPLVIIPTAVNYDRTLEDRNLTEELLGKEDRSTKFQKLKTTSEFLFKNTLRSAFRRFKRYGYAVVSFGEPIVVDEFIQKNPALLDPEFERRKGSLLQLAELIMTHISDALPVTPVPLVASIFARNAAGLTSDEMIGQLSKEMEGNRAPWLLREKSGESVWEAARATLELRHLIEQDAGGCWHWSEEDLLLRDYYANSLLSFDDVKQRGWRERSPESVETRRASAGLGEAGTRPAPPQGV